MSNELVREAKQVLGFPKSAIRDVQFRGSFKKDLTMLRELKKRGFNLEAVFNNGVRSTDFESACSQELVNTTLVMTGHPSALRIPFEALYSKRASTDYVTDVGGNAAGGYLVETEIPNQSPVEPLRATSCILSAGATVIESDKH